MLDDEQARLGDLNDAAVLRDRTDHSPHQQIVALIRHAQMHAAPLHDCRETRQGSGLEWNGVLQDQWRRGFLGRHKGK